MGVEQYYGKEQNQGSLETRHPENVIPLESTLPLFSQEILSINYFIADLDIKGISLHFKRYLRD